MQNKETGWFKRRYLRGKFETGARVASACKFVLLPANEKIPSIHVLSKHTVNQFLAKLTFKNNLFSLLQLTSKL